MTFSVKVQILAYTFGMVEKNQAALSSSQYRGDIAEHSQPRRTTKQARRKKNKEL